MRTYDTIVIPTDLSAASVAALEEGRALAAPATRIELVLVLDRIPHLDGRPHAEDAEREAQALEALREFAGRNGLGDAHPTVLTTIGNAAIEIARFAETSGADLLVIASHGRTGVSRVHVGSVAERVVRYAHCPVLVVKTAPAAG